MIEYLLIAALWSDYSHGAIEMTRSFPSHAACVAEARSFYQSALKDAAGQPFPGLGTARLPGGLHFDARCEARIGGAR